jgi:hypothetical protein
LQKVSRSCIGRCIGQKISALRASASHAYDDIGVTVVDGRSTVLNGDENSLVWGRTPAQVPSSAAYVAADQCVYAMYAASALVPLLI